VVPVARQPPGHALGGGLVGEGSDPHPVIRAVRAVPGGQVCLGVPVLHLRQYLLGVALLVIGAHLDLIDERFLRALDLRGGCFRDDHPHWGDAVVQDAHTVRRGVRQIDDTAFGVGVRPAVRDLDLDVFAGGAIFDQDFGAQGQMAVGSRQLLWREALAIGGHAAVEPFPVIGGQAALPVPVIRPGGGPRQDEQQRASHAAEDGACIGHHGHGLLSSDDRRCARGRVGGASPPRRLHVWGRSRADGLGWPPRHVPPRVGRVSASCARDPPAVTPCQASRQGHRGVPEGPQRRHRRERLYPGRDDRPGSTQSQAKKPHFCLTTGASAREAPRRAVLGQSPGGRVWSP
jgi:hypothetical protein